MPGPLLDCVNPPDIVAPSDGVVGWLDDGPTKLVEGKTLDEGGALSWYETHGLNVPQFVNYDLTCGDVVKGELTKSFLGEQATELFNDPWLFLANFGLTTLSWAVAGFAYLVRIVYGGTLDLLDPILQMGASIFGLAVFMPGIIITGGVAALLMIVRSRQDDPAKNARVLRNITLIVGVVIVTITLPLMLGQLADRLVGTTTAVVFDQAARAGNSAAQVLQQATAGETAQLPVDPSARDLEDLNGADQILGAVYAATLQPAVLAGNLGKVDGDAVKKYGPCIVANGTITRVEDQGTADERREAAEAREDGYRECAKGLKEEFPESYEYLAGEHNSSRLGAVVIGWVAFAMLAIIFAAPLGAVLYFLLLVRSTQLGAPLVGLLAMIPRYAPMFWGAMDHVIGWLKKGAVGICIAAFDTAATMALLNPASGVDPLDALFLLFMLNVTLLGVWRTATKYVKRERTATQAADPSKGADAKTNGSDATVGGVGPMPAEGGAFVTGARAAAGSALTGGLTGLAAGGPAGALAGAARGAALGAAARTATAVAGSSAPVAIAAVSSIRALPTAPKQDVPASPPGVVGAASPTLALPAAAADAPGNALPPEVGRTAPPAAPAPEVHVFRPDEPSYAGPERPTHAPDGTRVWTPEEAHR